MNYKLQMALLSIIIFASCSVYSHTYKVTNNAPYVAHVKVGVGASEAWSKSHAYDIAPRATQEFVFGSKSDKRLCFNFLKLTVKDNKGEFQKKYSASSDFISQEKWNAGIGAGAGALVGSVGGPGGAIAGAAAGGLAGSAVAATKVFDKYCGNMEFEINPTRDSKKRFVIVVK